MNRSGAQLAWDFFYPSTKRPSAVDHVGNRDLWRKSEKDSFAFAAFVYPLGYHYELYLKYLQDQSAVDEAIRNGYLIIEKNNKIIEEVAKRAVPRILDGYPTLYVELKTDEELNLTSDIGDYLDKKASIAAMINNNNKVSLRSDQNGPDVSVIAKKWGGGGHPHASGFTIHPDKSITDIFKILNKEEL
jgi:oligoribonuclease NrnB/cAMP/cGMP phosphodiesterase (DHH superfamily)